MKVRYIGESHKNGISPSYGTIGECENLLGTPLEDMYVGVQSPDGETVGDGRWVCWKGDLEPISEPVTIENRLNELAALAHQISSEYGVFVGVNSNARSLTGTMAWSGSNDTVPEFKTVFYEEEK